MSSRSGPSVEDVEAYLNGQGYPLEFKVSRAFRAALQGFSISFVSQGEYVPESGTDKQREIDILAEVVDSAGWCLFRVAFVVECKHAPVPWAFFIESGMSQSVVTGTADTVASPLARTALWVAEHSSKTSVWEPVEPDSALAFGACDVRVDASGKSQSSRKPELSYAALQGVVGNAQRYVDLFDGGDPPTLGIAVPVIVVDGDIYEATYDDVSGKITAEAGRWLPVGWNGSPQAPGRAIVHVVQVGALDDWLAALKGHLPGFLRDLKWSLSAMKSCTEEGTLDPIELPPGPQPHPIPDFIEHAIAFHKSPDTEGTPT